MLPAFLFASSKICNRNGMEQNTSDVLIIGAGAAGLLAALEVVQTGRTVTVLEAKDRCGGRMHTVFTNEGFPVELGAEFVHGNLPVTKELLQKAGGDLIPVNGSIWQSRNGKLSEQKDFIEDYGDLKKKFKDLQNDVSVAEFFEKQLSGEKYGALRFSLKNYVEGYYAADIAKASTFALREELSKGDEEQYHIKGGYAVLVNYLEEQCRQKGVTFRLSTAVQSIHWKQNQAAAGTNAGVFAASKVLITVPIGVLQGGAIRFSPELPHKLEAARSLGFGPVAKVVFVFEKAFWAGKEQTQGSDLSDLNFLFSDQVVPTWWTQHPQKLPLLVGWLGGPKTEVLLNEGREAVIQKALHSLSAVFGVDVVRLSQQVVSANFYNWSEDEFARGAYSYEVVNGEASINELLQPVEKTVYFAGEGLHHGPEIGTVEAALQSGRNVAHRLIADV